MTHEVKLFAIASATTIHVELVQRDAFHLRLHHRIILEIIAVGAEAAASLFVGHVPSGCDTLPERAIGRWFNRCLFWPQLPLVDHHLAVLAVLGCRNNLLLRQTKFNHHVVHQEISLPEARIVRDVAALANVEIKPPSSSTWPTNSGQV